MKSSKYLSYPPALFHATQIVESLLILSMKEYVAFISFIQQSSLLYVTSDYLSKLVVHFFHDHLS